MSTANWEIQFNNWLNFRKLFQTPKMKDPGDFTPESLHKCSYRFLQKTAKNMGLPSNVKKVYLIQLIHAKKYCNVAEVDNLVRQVRMERQQSSSVRKRAKTKKKHIQQSTEVSSTSNSKSPPITATPKRVSHILIRYSPDQYSPPRPRINRAPHRTIGHPNNAVISASDRVLRSFRNVKTPAYVLNNALIGIIKSSSSDESVKSFEHEIPLLVDKYQQVNFTKKDGFWRNGNEIIGPVIRKSWPGNEIAVPTQRSNCNGNDALTITKTNLNTSILKKNWNTTVTSGARKGWYGNDIAPIPRSINEIVASTSQRNYTGNETLASLLKNNWSGPNAIPKRNWYGIDTTVSMQRTGWDGNEIAVSAPRYTYSNQIASRLNNDWNGNKVVSSNNVWNNSYEIPIITSQRDTWSSNDYVAPASTNGWNGNQMPVPAQNSVAPSSHVGWLAIPEIPSTEVAQDQNMSPQPVRQQRRLSGIYPLSEEPKTSTLPNVSVRRADGTVSKLNAFIQKQTNEKTDLPPEPPELPLNMSTEDTRMENVSSYGPEPKLNAYILKSTNENPKIPTELNLNMSTEDTRMENVPSDDRVHKLNAYIQKSTNENADLPPAISLNMSAENREIPPPLPLNIPTENTRDLPPALPLNRSRENTRAPELPSNISTEDTRILPTATFINISTEETTENVSPMDTSRTISDSSESYSTEETVSNTSIVKETQGEYTMYYHKKIRAEKVRSRVKEVVVSSDCRLPKINDVFSKFNSVYGRDLTQPIYVQVENDPAIAPNPFIPNYQNYQTSMLESLFNLKNSFIVNQPLLQIATTTNTRCVYSTPVICTAKAQPTAGVPNLYNALSRDSPPYCMDEGDSRVHDFFRNFRCDEVLSDTTLEVRRSSSPAESLQSQDLGANVTIPEMVEDALELISQDGDYLERMGMDIRMQCVLCEWAGPKIILEYHIRKEHESEIMQSSFSCWCASYTLGALSSRREWRSTVVEHRGRLFVVSAKYEDPDRAAAMLSTLSTEDDLPTTGSITTYNKVTGEPYTWKGVIPQLPPTLTYTDDPNCLKLELSRMNLLPNSANLKLLNRELVVRSPTKVVVGQPELDNIHISLIVKLDD